MGVPVVVLSYGLVRFVYEGQLERECLNGVQAWAVLQITNNVVGSGLMIIYSAALDNYFSSTMNLSTQIIMTNDHTH